MLDCEEDHGVIVSLTRLYRVIGITNTDYTALWAALANTNPAPGIPQFGDTLPAIAPGAGGDPWSGLVVTRRSAKNMFDDKGTVDVTIKYEHIMQGPNQELFAPPSGFLFTKGKCSVREKPTNFYYPYGIRSGVIPNPSPDGTPTNGTTAAVRTRIVTSNQYVNDLELDRQFKEQLGEIKLPFPEGNIQFEGTLLCNDPYAYAMSLIATINQLPFLEQPERTWLCSEVGWQILRPDTGLYKFNFEMQNNPDTWDADVVFIDSRTNLPPSNVQVAVITNPGTGIADTAQNPLTGLPIPAGAWTVPALRRVDYNTVFAAFFA